MKRAIDKYVEFHQFDPYEIGEFARGFQIPHDVTLVGAGRYVLYSSDKLNPSTGEDEGFIDYIHEHKPGVRVYRPGVPGRSRRVPGYIRDVSELVLLGECMGFGYDDGDGNEVAAEPDAALTELYAIPSGKALIVVENKRCVCALIWGGKLGVEARGIVG